MIGSLVSSAKGTFDQVNKELMQAAVEPGKEFGKGWLNLFVSYPEYPPANLRDFVRPNFDTLYSTDRYESSEEHPTVA